jgi:hypothetical protein
MCCALWHETEDKPADVDQSTALAGTLVSSLHRLKDKNNVGECTAIPICFSKERKKEEENLTGIYSLDGAYFVFGDLSVRVEGTFRLKFNLFEMKQYARSEVVPSERGKLKSSRDRVVYLKSVLSKPFQGKQKDCCYRVLMMTGTADVVAVMSPKNFPGMAESSFLSRSFADQGVKLRIRKDSRTLL